MLMTRDGHDRLRAELEQLATIDRGELADRLRSARQETGEPCENRELLDALQDSVRLERRIRLLEERLSSAEIADGAAAEGFVTVGSRVRLRRLRGRRVLEYEVVGAGEADPSRRRISAQSPMGRALIGRRPGDLIDVEAPSHRLRYRLLAVDPAVASSLTVRAPNRAVAYAAAA
jgi:transcription elongation factor GreA